MSMMIRRYIILSTGVYETLKSSPSIMDDTYAHVLKYKSYWRGIWLWTSVDGEAVVKRGRKNNPETIEEKCGAEGLV